MDAILPDLKSDIGTATVKLIASDTWHMACLEAVNAIGLNDWLIVAGFVRNLIWDHLHGRETATSLNDVDVAFFDPSDLSRDTESNIEARLAAAMPDVRWQVRNQARMHLRNGHKPYKSVLDAISYYPELPTCVGVRITETGEVKVEAPHGIQHNWSLTIRANPKTGYSAAVVEQRAAEKRWLEIWPHLRMEPQTGISIQQPHAAPEGRADIE